MIIVSGPSGVGKSTLIGKLRAANSLEFLVPSTTREIRSEEIADQDYEFVDIGSFQAGIQSGRFADWDYALSNYYGFREDPLFDSGRPAITHALARMAVRLRSRHPSIKLVFLRPAHAEAHVARLTERFDDETARMGRLEHWREELAHEALFDHVLTVGGACEALEPQHNHVWGSLGLKAG